MRSAPCVEPDPLGRVSGPISAGKLPKTRYKSILKASPRRHRALQVRMVLDARPLREGCLFVVALKAAAGAPRGGGCIFTKKQERLPFQEMGQNKAKKACKTPPSTPKDPREIQQQRITTVRWPFQGAPDRAQEDPNGASKTPLGHRGGRQNSAKEKPRDP